MKMLSNTQSKMAEGLAKAMADEAAVYICSLTPALLATIVAEWDSDKQAAFFNAFYISNDTLCRANGSYGEKQLAEIAFSAKKEGLLNVAKLSNELDSYFNES